MLEELQNSEKVVGIKQARRALDSSRVKKLFLARDADPALVGALETRAIEGGINVCWAESMRALGAACGISVGAAVAAIV